METRYKITVERFTVNPNYAEEYKEWRERNRYGNNYSNAEPVLLIPEKSLTSELTEDEFKAVKKACLEVM